MLALKGGITTFIVTKANLLFARGRHYLILQGRDKYSAERLPGGQDLAFLKSSARRCRDPQVPGTMPLNTDLKVMVNLDSLACQGL
jgi:hypothetical protein